MGAKVTDAWLQEGNSNLEVWVGSEDGGRKGRGGEGWGLGGAFT